MGRELSSGLIRILFNEIYKAEDYIRDFFQYNKYLRPVLAIAESKMKKKYAAIFVIEKVICFIVHVLLKVRAHIKSNIGI